jgi:sugar O-acyltransferase (sialic acid O-acetyltransferase NeuD family)
MKSIVIMGASGHGKVIADIAKKLGYDDISFLDDNKTGVFCGYPIKGGCCRFNDFDCDFSVAIGNATVREKLMKHLFDDGKKVPALIHPGAVVADDVSIGEGTVVVAGAVINPCAEIGKGCIINTCSSVDHDCVIGDYAHISVGAHIAGTVCVGKGAWIGAGATVSNNITICSDVLVGAGAVVVKDINEIGTYIGVPAKKI